MTELIVVDDFTDGPYGRIYFNTRQRLPERVASAVRRIEGVANVLPLDYGLMVIIGGAFGFTEVSAPVLRILAQSLGVTLDELQVEPSKQSFHAAEDRRRINEALVLAKEQERQSQIAAEQAGIGPTGISVPSWRKHIKNWFGC